MVSVEEARAVFGKAFSRPPRLLFGNPVAFLFSAYYAYIYGRSYTSTYLAGSDTLFRYV
jgi:DHA1 family multidrug resistance protein-like MFS transporter